MHTTLKNAETLKHSKLDKNTPTCFSLHRNHLQGAKVSAWLKITRLVDRICVKDVQGVVCFHTLVNTHTRPELVTRR